MRTPLALALFLTTSAHAQTHAISTLPTDPTGSVTGHVFCADTNEPARLAKVSLERIPDPPAALKSTPGTAPAAPPPPTPKPNAPRITTITETALDGSFTLSKVKPGNYYVVVEKAGYIKPRDMFTQKEINDPTPATRTLVEAVLPRVRVDPDQVEHAEVRLQRGAAVSGTVRYDDGSPAAGLDIALLHKDDKGKWIALPGTEGPRMGNNIATDDRGYFRMPSLLPDEYLLKVTLDLSDLKTSSIGDGDREMMFAMSSTRSSLAFYGAGIPRQKDATPINLHAGEELTGQDVVLPISKLHRLTGRVAAGRDAHFVNSAGLSLVTRDDGKELASSAVAREDGLFHFDFLPDGDYILKIKNARDVTWDPVKPNPSQPFSGIENEKERILTAYGSSEMPVLLSGDLLGLTATVPPNTKPDPPITEAQPQ